MEFTYTYDDLRVTVQISRDSTISEIEEAFKSFLLAAGYSPLLVEDLFRE
jgi:hypothetical protein